MAGEHIGLGHLDTSGKEHFHLLGLTKVVRLLVDPQPGLVYKQLQNTFPVNFCQIGCESVLTFFLVGLVRNELPFCQFYNPIVKIAKMLIFVTADS